MAAVMAVQPLAPRPSPHIIAAWPPPKPIIAGKESRPTHKQTEQSNSAARARRERPCDGCRRRKSKCVLQEARRCVLCEFHKQDCTFVENAQPRKRKLDDGSKSDTPSKKSPTTTTSSTASSSPRQQYTTPLASQLPAASLQTHIPSTVDESLSLQRHRHCKYLGPTTGLDASLIGLGCFNEKNETASQVGDLRQVTSSEYFSTHADADVPIPDDEARALAEIDATVGPHGPGLIDIYFRNVHPSYPILQKKVFLDRHRRGDRQFNPPLLAAMYLLALDWWSHEPKLAQHRKPDTARLEYIAITSLTIAMQRPKISAVQAGLLLLQRSKSSTWTLTVQLVALGQDIGLHLDCSDWSIPLWERRLRKRLAWALYMQDKWSALMHGRPSHINVADWAVSSPTTEDFQEDVSPAKEDSPDPEIAKGRTLFLQMIALTSIMAEVCATFYSQSAKAEYARAGRFATQLVLNRAKPVQIKLKDWFAKLPPECKMDAFTPKQLSSTGYLHLGYFATEISIHRRIVQSLDPVTADPYMLYICRSAAKTRLISAMDFVNRLRPEHLDAFWYFASTSNFALIGTFGALLMATSPAREEVEFYRWRLHEFKWTLSVSAKKANWISGALEMLEANLEMLKGLPEKGAAVPMKQAPPAQAPSRPRLEELHGSEGEDDDDDEDAMEMQDGYDLDTVSEEMDVDADGWSTELAV
ncbi:Fungal specific transcription factor [Vermiconidia calcicola]|uniref:Fungal specific transcription factor n=1 Tax=Vermiconidia calcicola TaxID=1690605 RepID=A0ACC3NR59_9PEZI|nr:Fungal specific transcription factor [Vermiconidia calcicola]